MSRLVVRAVGAGTRDHKVRSASERQGRDDEGDDDDDDKVVRDRVIR